MRFSRSCLLAAGMGLLHALALPTAQAQAPRWYVEAESRGPCGEECYTPPTAWIYGANGAFAFGVQCAGEMVLGGPAMAQLTDPITSVEMAIDGRSYGRFDVQTGLADFYVRPTLTGDAQDWARSVRPALAAGATVQLWLGSAALLEFGLAGSRAALDSLDAQCAAPAGPAALPGGETAPEGAAWPTSPSFPPGLEFSQGLTVDGWTDTGYGGWLGNRASDGLELWVTLVGRGSDGVYVVVTPAGYAADGGIATWRVVTSLYLPPDRQPPTSIAWGPCRSADYQTQDLIYARWNGGADPAEAWAFVAADARFERLSPGAYLCAYEEH
ncbi:MAG: hypothetical protein ACFCVH_08090 [Alphaproteobacteria bacterium]